MARKALALGAGASRWYTRELRAGDGAAETCYDQDYQRLRDGPAAVLS
jgi:hypothetical protein